MKENKNKIEKVFFKIFPRFEIGKELDFFMENLASLLSAGIPVLDTFYSLSSEITTPRFKKIISSIIKDIESGISISKALMNTSLFSKHTLVLLEMGEKSGKLVDNLKIIAEEEKKRRSLKAKIRSAVMYPFFVIGLTIFVAIGISWFILPKLSIVFSQLKIDLPFITRKMIEFGSFMNQYGFYAILVFIILVFLFIFFIFYFKKTNFIGEKILFILPGVGALLIQSEIARFAYLLGTLLRAGVSPNEALYSISESTNWRRYKIFYLFLANSVSEGNSFKKSFDLYPKLNKIFPSSVKYLISAGEKSGSISDTLLSISKTYEEKTDTTAKDLSTILEPFLLVVVWLGVVMVALAVILPIYSLVGNFNR